MIFGHVLYAICICIGRFDLDDCIAVCANCDFTYGDSLADVINAGFWPSSAHSLNYLFSWQLLRLFDYLHKFVPGTSVMGFLNALEEISAHNGRVIFCRFICILYYSIVIYACRFPPLINQLL